MPASPIPKRAQFTTVAGALQQLDIVVAAVRGEGQGSSRFKSALDTLEDLANKEGIPLAIVGGLAAIHHGYERFTKDIDIVVAKRNLDSIIRAAPQYGIKVIWHDREGWHKLNCDGVSVDVVPEGGSPEPKAPVAIPGPKYLGVDQGTGYASLAGWMETKLGSNRVQDRADMVQVMKETETAKLAEVRAAIATVDPLYLARFDELLAAAAEESERERHRGGPR